MAIQMIFCVETNKKADTDSIYLMDAIRHLYIINNQVKISKVYMGSKSKYKSKSLMKEISEKTIAIKSGEKKVIYCIDTDEFEKNKKHEKELDDIRQFCEEHGYELLWFCHDVEEVFLGKTISDAQKVQEAEAFRRKRKIEEIQVEMLSSSVKRAHTSNLVQILDKYLLRT